MRKLILLICSLPLCLNARQKTKIPHPDVDVPYHPWLTGSLLAPTPINMELGHPAIEPSIAFLYSYGNYDDNWKLDTSDHFFAINPDVDFQFATTKRTGIEIIPSYIINFKDGKRSAHFQDTIVYLGYQVLNDEKGTWIPDFRFLLEILFPTGNHDRLNPDLLGIDLTGQGAYFFGPNLSFQKLFYLEKHFFIFHWSIGYAFPTKTKFKDHNAYGGGFGAKGEIRPGQILTAFLSGEYSFNQHFVFAFDTQILYQGATSDFKGRPGAHTNGETASIGLPASFQLSFAPQLEYNFSADFGILFGAWATLAGRNSPAFVGGFFAALYVF